MREGESLMTIAGIGNKNLKIQRGASKYYASTKWSCERKGQNLDCVWQIDPKGATRCNKVKQSCEFNHNHGIIYVQVQIGVWQFVDINTILRTKQTSLQLQTYNVDTRLNLIHDMLFDEHKVDETNSIKRLKTYMETYPKFKYESPSTTFKDIFNTSNFN